MDKSDDETDSEVSKPSTNIKYPPYKLIKKTMNDMGLVKKTPN